MIAAQPAHPAKDQLIAFGQGKLPDEDSSRIERHLESCRECCETLLDLKDDTFTGLVRHAKQIAPAADAGPVVSPAAEQPTDGHVAGLGSQAATLLAQSTETVSGCELPAELRDHPRYRVVELIGQGGMGAVYRAEHRLMNRAVAIKLINAQLVQHPQAVERFRREVQAAAKLSHPNIVAAYDAEQAGNAHFLVMEFVDGTDLATVVEQRGPMPVAEACECIRQAAAGLQHAHEKGMVHRDIKPHNLMLAAGGQVRILDFGLAGFATESALCGPDSFNGEPKANACGGTPGAKAQSSDGATSQDADAFGSPLNEANPRTTYVAAAAHLTALGSVMGTPDYMAPEQAADAHSADVRADIYSLGCTLHFLLTSKPPFEADNAVAKIMAHAELPRPDLTAVRADVPAELANVVARMMAKNPAERFQTPAEVAAALALFARPAVAAPRKRSLRKILAAAAAILLAGVIYITTDKGRFEIRSEVDDVEVVVSRGGKEVKTIDIATGSQVTWLPSGDYRISLKQDRNDVHIDRDGFQLSRWGKQIISVKLVPMTATKTDHERIQGEWVAESGVRYGEPTPLDQIDMQRMTFDGDKLHVNGPSGKKGDGHFQLTETSNPKKIGVFVTADTRGLRGIYKLEGDRLTICFDKDQSAEAPTSFAAAARTTLDLIVLRRAGSNQSPSGAPVASTTASDADWTPLFNKTDLTGWMPHPDMPGNWRVDQGILIGDADAQNVFLVSERGDFENFHLRVEVRVNSVEADSGVVFDYTLGTWAGNSEVNISFDPQKTDHQTGSLKIFNQPWSKAPAGMAFPTEWFVLELIVRDEHVISKVNGRIAAESRARKAGSRGHIMLQQRGPKTVVEFRKVEIMELEQNVARDGSTRPPVADAAQGLPSGVVDQMLLQGWWIAVSGHAGGQPIPAEQLPKFSIKIDQDQVTIAPPGDPSQEQRGTFKVHATNTPKRIDIVVAGKKEPMAGIYEIDQNQLKLSLVDGDAARPTDFSPSDRAGHITGVFERAPYTGTSEYVEFRPAGLNGSFEITQYGLPVNWHMSTPKREQGSDFDIMMDTTDFKEGKQSLKFVVRKCDEKRGPGFFKEFAPNQNPPAAFETKPGETYKISFWAKNAGSEFVFRARGVSAFGGDEGAVIRSKETFNEWRRFECTTTLPSKMWLRVQLSIVQPGAFWIDDLQILRVNDARLQGSWIAVSGLARKQPIPAEQLAKFSITFDGEQVTITPPGNPPVVQRGTFKSDETSTPKRIDFIAADKKETMPGIYEFDGEQLKLAVVDGDYARPTNFDPEDRADHMTLVFKRVSLRETLGDEETKVLKATEAFLAVMDEGRFGQLFDMGSMLAKRQSTRDKTSQTHQQLRDAAGKIEQRTLHRVRLMDEFLGRPPGRYAAVLYRSDFEKHKGLWESVLLNVDDDGQWRVNTYALAVEPLPIPDPRPRERSEDKKDN